MISASAAEYVVPDVIVSKRNGRWLVELNPEIAPRLRINSYYAAMIRRADNSADNVFLQDNLQEANWFIKSLQSRNETLLKVARCIVERQQGFLEHGPEAMKPLVLHDVATAVGMHESTISRVTDAEIHAYARRDIRAQVLLLQPRQHRRRRGMLIGGDPGDHQESWSAPRTRASR